MRSKKIKQEIIKIEYSENCPVCNYKIIGTSENQVKYNLKVHAMQKHNFLFDFNKLPKPKSNKEMLKDIKKEVKK